MSSSLFSHSDNKNSFIGQNSTLNFNLTKAEYEHAIEDFCFGDSSEHSRIITHEYCHWVQYTGTPYGYYLELVYHYENKLLQQIIELLAERLYQNNQIESTPPFKKYIENCIFSNIHDEHLWNKFEQWLDLFFLLSESETSRDEYYNYVIAHKTILSSYSSCNQTQNIDNYLYLPLLFYRLDQFFDEELSDYIGRTPTQRDINNDREIIYSKKNYKAFISTGFNGMSLRITHQSLWESFATVIEFLDTPDDFCFPIEDFTYNNEVKSFNEYYDPLRMLEINLPSAKHDKKLFLQSCAYLFDIVFSPPILPQCKLLREDVFSVFDFDITARFYAVAEAARVIGPMNNFKSGGEYSSAICHMLHWHTPDEVYLQIRRCWDSLNIIPAGKMFQLFIDCRMAGHSIFFNRQRFLSEVYARNINPCFLKLKDCFITNSNFSFHMNFEAWNELMFINAYLHMPALFPEPLKHDFEYYQYTLLQELVEIIWESGNKHITLSIPKECTSIKKIQDYLVSWLKKHYIDVQLSFDTF